MVRVARALRGWHDIHQFEVPSRLQGGKAMRSVSDDDGIFDQKTVVPGEAP
jgi:hypothetical protein